MYKKILIRCFFYLTILILSNQEIFATSNQETDILYDTTEKFLAVNNSDDYEVHIPSNKLIIIELNQYANDFSLQFISPDGRILVEINNPEKEYLYEKIYWGTPNPGKYKIKITLVEHVRNLAKYSCKVLAIKTNDANSLNLYIEAQQKILEANNLAEKEEKEFLEKAISNYIIADKTIKNLDPYLSYVSNHNAGSISYKLKRYDKSLEFFNKALNLSKINNDKVAECITLNNIGIIFDEQNQPEEAKLYYLRSLEIAQNLDLKWTIGNIFNNLGLVNKNLNNISGAIKDFERSIVNLREVNKPDLIIALQNLGLIYRVRGDFRNALDLYTQAQKLAEELNKTDLLAFLFNNLGQIYDLLGEKTEALTFFNNALSLSKKIGNTFLEANILNNMGSFYNSLSFTDEALRYYEQSLVIAENLLNISLKATIMSNIGTVYEKSFDNEKALEYYEKALLLRSQLKSKDRMEIIHNKIARIYITKNQFEKAVTHLNAGLNIAKELNNLSSEIDILNTFSLVHEKTENFEKSLEDVFNALALSEEIKDQYRISVCLYRISKLKMELNQISEAKIYISKAINLVENLRKKIASNNLRTYYSSTINDYYRLAISLNMVKHVKENSNSVLALDIYERFRSRTLSEVILESTYSASLSDPLSKTYEELKEKFDAKSRVLISLLNKKNLNSEKVTLETELLSISTKIDDIEGQIKKNNPEFYNLLNPQTVSLDEIQKLLSEDEILLEYCLGEEKSFLWVVTKTGFNSYTLPSSAKINSLATKFKFFLSDHKTDINSEQYNKLISSLSEILLGQIINLKNKKTVIIVPDGTLQTMPFSALSFNNNKKIPLVFTHEIVYLPSASTIKILRSSPQNNKNNLLLAVGDPVYTIDDRITKLTKDKENKESADEYSFNDNLLIETYRNNNLVNLPYSREEVEKIVSIFNNKQTTKLLDFDANIENILNINITKYKYLHFAAHAITNDKDPKFSSIVLSLVDKKGAFKEGFLTANKISSMKLECDLVVLSACKTALGKELNGEGIIGLSRVFLHAGSKNVIASFWNVNDKATSELMAKLYANLLVAKFSPSRALQLAQIFIIKETKYTHPFYWAGFQSLGDWTHAKEKINK